MSINKPRELLILRLIKRLKCVPNKLGWPVVIIFSATVVATILLCP